MKVISFALWGQNPGYVVGAISNLKLAQLYYPDWRCRIYCHSEVSFRRQHELRDAGFDVYQRRSASPNDGLFWRFEPAFDGEVEAFISRDCDSRLNPREVAAVNEWLASGKKLHTMRDHYEHIVPVLGGMWGCRHWPEFGPLMDAWMKSGRTGKMGQDQDFLKEVIWPLVRNDSVAHDLYTTDTTVPTPNGPFKYRPVEFYGKHDLRPFPKHPPLDETTHGKHVGARVWV